MKIFRCCIGDGCFLQGERSGQKHFGFNKRASKRCILKCTYCMYFTRNKKTACLSPTACQQRNTSRRPPSKRKQYSNVKNTHVTPKRHTRQQKTWPMGGVNEAWTTTWHNETKRRSIRRSISLSFLRINLSISQPTKKSHPQTLNNQPSSYRTNLLHTNHGTFPSPPPIRPSTLESQNLTTAGTTQPFNLFRLASIVAARNSR